MKRTDLPFALQTLLKTTPYVAIATVCTDGQPWNTPVFARFDDELNLYWVSWQDNQHSRNITAAPRIFVVAYDTSVPAGKGLGLYLQMTARPLETPEEVRIANRWYDTSFFRLQDGRLPTFIGNCPSRIYKASLLKAWYNVDGRRQGHFIDRRRAITTKA